MGKQRFEWIDIAKGIGILLVVYGHCQPPPLIEKFVYAFHMPLFFFISGFLFRHKAGSFHRFIKGKVKRLLIPYFVFSLISIPMQYLRFRAGEVDSFNMEQLFFNFFNLNGSVIYNIPLWFLMCLFVCMNLFYFISQLKWVIQLLILIPLSLFSYYLSLHYIRLPFSVDIAFYALIFVFLGYQSKKLLFAFQKQKKVVLFIIFLTSGFVTYLFSTMHGRISMGAMVIENPFYFFFAALTGICMVFSLSILIKFNTPLVYFGKNSLAILVNHFYVLSFFGVILTVTGIKNYMFENYLALTSIIYFVFYLFLSFPANKVYDFIENKSIILLLPKKRKYR